MTNGRPDWGRDARVDQVGYPTWGTKHAVVRADASSFAVRRCEDGKVVYEGDLSEPIDDPDAGERVRRAAFSELTDPGEYVLVAGPERGDDASAGEEDAEAESHEFRIGDDVYDPVLRDVGRLYALKRTDTDIEDPETGLEVGPGHPQDAEARLYFGDEFRDEGESIDVSGGWYDAGDYGKYVPPAAITVGQQLLAYELYPGAFESGQFDLPPGLSEEERAAGMPDLLAEAKFELEWLERMQRPDGALYHKVAAEEWPAIDERPTDDERDRYVFGLSTFGTAMAAAAMAMAARVYEPFDVDFADRMLDGARRAQEWLEANPKARFRFDEGQGGGSGPYRKETDRGERFWAAAELLKTTGEDRYAEHLETELADQFDEPVRPPTWGDGLALGQWAYYTVDAGDPDRQEEIGAAFRDYADDLVESIEADGYRDALATADYHWASSKLAVAKGDLLLLANEIDPDPSYVEAALDQLHYVLGRNPTGYSYVTGHGSRPVENPHDRIVESTGTAIPGMLVSGANRNGDDERLAAFIEDHSPPPAKAFVDDALAHSATEWAIDYTAPLFVVLGFARSKQKSGEA